MSIKLSDQDREAIRQLKKRMDLCWLEMLEAELREAHLQELCAISEELLRVLNKYGLSRWAEPKPCTRGEQDWLTEESTVALPILQCRHSSAAGQKLCAASPMAAANRAETL